jgi:hypothetical protein
MKPSRSVEMLEQLDCVNQRFWELRQLLTQPHLVECVDAAWLQTVAAKCTAKVMVALQERDLNSATSEEVGKGCSGWPGADDYDALGVHA